VWLFLNVPYVTVLSLIKFHVITCFYTQNTALVTVLLRATVLTIDL